MEPETHELDLVRPSNTEITLEKLNKQRAEIVREEAERKKREQLAMAKKKEFKSEESTRAFSKLFLELAPKKLKISESHLTEYSTEQLAVLGKLVARKSFLPGLLSCASAGLIMAGYYALAVLFIKYFLVIWAAFSALTLFIFTGMKLSGEKKEIDSWRQILTFGVLWPFGWMPLILFRRAFGLNFDPLDWTEDSKAMLEFKNWNYRRLHRLLAKPEDKKLPQYRKVLERLR